MVYKSSRSASSVGRSAPSFESVGIFWLKVGSVRFGCSVSLVSHLLGRVGFGAWCPLPPVTGETVLGMTLDSTGFLLTELLFSKRLLPFSSMCIVLVFGMVLKR